MVLTDMLVDFLTSIVILAPCLIVRADMLFFSFSHVALLCSYLTFQLFWVEVMNSCFHYRGMVLHLFLLDHDISDSVIMELPSTQTNFIKHVQFFMPVFLPPRFVHNLKV